MPLSIYPETWASEDNPIVKVARIGNSTQTMAMFRRKDDEDLETTSGPKHRAGYL